MCYRYEISYYHSKQVRLNCNKRITFHRYFKSRSPLSTMISVFKIFAFMFCINFLHKWLYPTIRVAIENPIIGWCKTYLIFLTESFIHIIITHSPKYFPVFYDSLSSVERINYVLKWIAWIKMHLSKISWRIIEWSFVIKENVFDKNSFTMYLVMNNICNDIQLLKKVPLK